jgi:hypothetical protein
MAATSSSRRRYTVQTSKAADGILSRFRQGIFAIATLAR